MSPETFIAWLADMKPAGLARSDADCAEFAVAQSAKKVADAAFDVAYNAEFERNA